MQLISYEVKNVILEYSLIIGGGGVRGEPEVLVSVASKCLFWQAIMML